MNKYKIVVFFSFLLLNVGLYSQQDTLNFSNNFLRSNYWWTPKVISYEYEFDTVTGDIIAVPKIGNINAGHPEIYDFNSFLKRKNTEFFSNNWNSYNLVDRDFLDNFMSPQLNIGIKGLGKIFGSDEVSVVPSGTINLNFGVTYYSIDNPVLPKRSRRNIVPEFTQDIQIGVNGKVGTKMNVGINYNTKSMFDFENRKKIEYDGEEDEIIKKIEAGNVSFPIENTLINGSSTLFGIRTDLQFGRLSVTSVVSQQKGQSKTIEIQSGSVLNDFEISAGDYDADRHFFLNHYFRDHYETALANLPVVTSNIKITRIEVWVTNKTSDFSNARNIVAFMDLGEEKAENIYSSSFVTTNGSSYPANDANNLYDQLTGVYSGIRDIANVSGILSSTPLVEGVDYVKLESARKLDPKEYVVNTDLGYISLNYNLKPGEILAVAYEYTVDGKTYQVGEFSNEVDAPSSLILKLLRGPASVPKLPTWDLMMKNIYSLGTYSLKKEDFQLEVFYNNDRLGTKTNYIPEGDIANKRLLRVFRFDNADVQNNPHPDGFFDFIEGITVDTKNGLIIFPELEPFGKFLAKQIGNQYIAKKYVFNELYDSTQYIAKQTAVKNKFFLKGKYKSSSGNEIMLNVLNLPEGAVHVTQGGVELQEGVDYSVDYNIGRVTILNESLLRSGMPIKISIESNDQYGMITKNLVGTHLNYQFSNDFNMGFTAMHLSEIPMDPKTRFGEEPVSNSIFGINTNFSRELPFVTKMVDALPFIQTKAPSKLDVTAEFAYLLPGNPKLVKRINNEKQGVSYIDDFENSQSFIDMKSPLAWTLASIPQGQPDMFPEASDQTSRISGYNRALFCWYEVSDDLVSQTSTVRPSYITLDDMSNHLVRQVFEKEIFPNRQNPYGTPPRISVLNVAFYPQERGPYNYDVEGEPGISAGINDDGTLKQPQTRWGGFMRDLYINDFESSNIGFLEFWVMDPFVYDSTSNGGDLYIDLGDISEDILRDSRKSIENGIPYPPDPTKVDTTQWGIVSKLQMTTQNFDNNPAARRIQDAGFDGLIDTKERKFFRDYIQRIINEYGVNSKAYLNAVNDPSKDDFRYFLDNYYDSTKASILDRYKQFNGVEGNSPVNTGNIDATAVTQYPDMEDVNRDNTLDNYEAYYQYHIHLSPDDMQVGKNYIVNKIHTKALGLPNNDDNQYITWYQIKIPLHSPDRIVGNVQGFKSIRFIRLFMRNFSKPIVLRFARFNFIRDEWRVYDYRISEGSEGLVIPQETGSGTLDVSVVNIEESTQKQPVNYVMPPGVSRNSNFFGEQVYKENEQSMVLKVVDLPDGEAKAVYKNVDMDMRRFRYMKMFVHEEALIGQENQLNDNDLTLFVRIGSDFTSNYYQYEISLKKTPAGVYYSDENDLYADDRYIVWPTENQLNLDLQTLVEAKKKRNIALADPNSSVSYNTPYITYDGNNKITVIGNPNLANVKAIMIGIKNPKKETNVHNDDGLPKSAEIWVDELRLTDFNNSGGWAANLRASLNLADLGNVTFAGYTHTPGFGSIEQRVNERYIDQAIEYDLTTQLQLGKFFPKKMGVSFPVYYGISNSISNPQYNPFDPDVKFNDALNNPALTAEQRASLKNAAQTFVLRRSFNITNVRIGGQRNSRQKKLKITAPWKISNFSTSFAYNEIFTRTPIIEYNYQQNLMYSLNYNYSPNSQPIRPFKKVKLFSKSAFKILKDFNFYYLPTRTNMSFEVNRQYVSLKSRSLGDYDLELPPSFRKDFLWKGNMDLTYKLSRGLKIDFSATDQARVEPAGWRDETPFRRWGLPFYAQDTVFMNIIDPGRNTDYHQKISVNYRVPINKLPLLKWVNLNLNYSSDYIWRRGQDPMPIPATDTTPAYTFNFGNMVQNTSVLRANARLNFSSIYRSIKFLRKVNSRFTRTGRKPRATKPKIVSFSKVYNFRAKRPVFINHNLQTDNITKVELIDANGHSIRKFDYSTINKNRIKIVLDTTLKNVSVNIVGQRITHESPLLVLSDYMLKSMMMLQNANMSYKIGKGALINGYMPEANLIGIQNFGDTWSPGIEFITGFYDRILLDKFSHLGWITTDTMFNKPFNFNYSEEMRLQVTLEPLNNVRLNLNFQRNMVSKENIYGYALNDAFLANTYIENGNFFISFNTIKSAFETLNYNKDSTFNSEFYSRFLDDRSFVSALYAERRKKIDPNYVADRVYDSISGQYFYQGYGPLSQDVLITSFLSAYSGIPVSKLGLSPFLNFPLPDWRISFDGLSNLPFLKDIVKKVSLTHSYSSTYTINNFQTNPNFNFDMYDTYGYSDAIYGVNNDFIPRYEVAGIMLSEKFVPLVGLDILFNNMLSIRIEYKRARDLFLSFSNNQLRERHNNTFTLGAGYTFKDLDFSINVNGKNQQLKSDLNMRLDISAGHDIEVFRKIVENFSQINTERNTFTLNFTADYSVSQKVGIQFYYSHSVMETNTVPKTVNAQGGFKIRITVAQ